MKILHVINNLTSGGAEKMLLDIVSRQIEFGNEVDVYLLSDQDNVWLSSFQEQRINVIYQKGTNVYFSFLKNSSYLNQIVKDYEVVHAHLFPSLYVVALLKNKGNFKKIFTEHSSFNKRMNFLFRPMERFIYSKYDQVICVSDVVKNKLKKHIGRNSLEVIYNGIDIKQYKNATAIDREDLGFAIEDIIIMMVGRFNYSKNQTLLVKSLKELDDQYKLLLIGEGPTKESVLDYVRSCKLERRVKIIGFTNKIPNYLKTVDYYVQASNVEGFGLAMVEAIASGVKVFCSNTPGMNQFLDERYQFNNHKELVELIKNNEPQQLKSCFFINDTVEKYQRIYHGELVSVVVPMYNTEKYIRKAIESVLNQSYQNIEVIIIDDGSTDNGLKVVKSFTDTRISIINQSNSGVSVARNNGLMNANGKYICFLDSDDYYDQDFIKLMLSQIEDNDAQYCGYHYLDEVRKRIYSRPKVFGQPLELSHLNAWMFNREFLLMNKLDFNERQSIGEDISFLYKMYEFGKINVVNKYLVNYIKRGNSTTNNTDIVGYVKNRELGIEIRKELIENHKYSDEIKKQLEHFTLITNIICNMYDLDKKEEIKGEGLLGLLANNKRLCKLFKPLLIWRLNL